MKPNAPTEVIGHYRSTQLPASERKPIKFTMSKSIDLTDLPGEEEAQKKRQEAFEAEFSWRGQMLHGLSSSRKDYWTAVCHIGGFPTIGDIRKNWDLFRPAAKALIFILSSETDDLVRWRAGGIHLALEAETEWIDENIPIDEEGKVVGLAISILHASVQNAAQPVPIAGAESKNSLGRSGKRPTSR